MASDVQIANLALTKLGDEGEIMNLNEDSRAARAVAGCFDDMRDATLRDHPWDFARHRRRLPALAAQPEWGGLTAYAKPADFIRFVEAEIPRGWLLEGDAILARGGGALNILYIRRITDTGRFDPLFTDALACAIARQIAIRITGSATVMEAMDDLYQEALSKARRVNGQEDQTRPDPLDDWILARERP